MKFVQHLIKAFKDWRYLPTQFLISKLKKSESAEIRSYAAEALGAEQLALDGEAEILERSAF